MAENLQKQIDSLKGRLKTRSLISQTSESTMAKPIKKVVKSSSKPEKASKKESTNGGGSGRGPQEVPDGFVSVGMLAEEAEIAPQSARVKLRASDIDRPEGRWLWKKGSQALKQARKVLGLA